MTPRNRILAFVVGAIFVMLMGFRLIADFLVDWSWFSSLDLSSIFWIRVIARLAVFALAFIATALILLANGFVAQRTAGLRPSVRAVPSPWNSIEGLTPPVAL